MAKILTLPDSSASAPSIRAKALVFHDPESQKLLEHVERLARSEATVLVIGETGTGKELIARHIHNVSGRPVPFIAVNCGALSENLIDAELFGHEAGAFTGAMHARPGWFEAANGGTLFLDEIGDLPMSLQVKLLRVLQERQVVRLGSRKPIPLDVRLIAATNVDLQRAVLAQHFRADLYYRLSVATVRLPSLHARQADILPLAEHFIAGYSARLGIAPARLSPEAARALQAYHWPGNIRELENVIHYALIVCIDGVIAAADLNMVPLAVPPEAASVVPLRGLQAPATLPAFLAPAPLADALPPAPVAEPPPVAPKAVAALPRLFRQILDEGGEHLFDAIEDALIRTAFDHCHQNQVRTARALGITRNILRTQLKRHGLLATPEQAAADTAQEVVAIARDAAPFPRVSLRSL